MNYYSTRDHQHIVSAAQAIACGLAPDGGLFVFKGKEYELLFLATHSETLEPMVVYRALYGERGIWVRPAAMWDEEIERDGQTVRRFTYIGE